MLPRRSALALLVCWEAIFLVSTSTPSAVAANPMFTNLVRIEETPAAYGPDEKETALMILREWGLGSHRLFAELAGACTSAQAHLVHDMPGFIDKLAQASRGPASHRIDPNIIHHTTSESLRFDPPYLQLE